MTFTYQELNTLAQGIAKILQARITQLADAKMEYQVKMQTPDLPLTLHISREDKKLHVNVASPTITNPATGQTVFMHLDDSVVTRIKCDPNRGAQKIADDIARKLIPNAKDAYNVTLKECEKREKSQREHRELILDLAKHFGVAPPPNNGETIYLPECKMQVSPTSVEMRSLYVTPDMAKRIIAMMRESKQ